MKRHFHAFYGIYHKNDHGAQVEISRGHVYGSLDSYKSETVVETVLEFISMKAGCEIKDILIMSLTILPD